MERGNRAELGENLNHFGVFCQSVPIHVLQERKPTWAGPELKFSQYVLINNYLQNQVMQTKIRIISFGMLHC